MPRAPTAMAAYAARLVTGRCIGRSGLGGLCVRWLSNHQTIKPPAPSALLHPVQIEPPVVEQKWGIFLGGEFGDVVDELLPKLLGGQPGEMRTQHDDRHESTKGSRIRKLDERLFD